MTSGLRTIATLIALAALLSATAQAQGFNDHDTGIVMSAGIGVSSIEDEDDPGDEFDGNGTAFNVDVEWRFLRHVSAGFSVGTLGEDTDEFNGASTTISVDTIGVFIRGLLPIGERVTLHARYGGVHYSVDVDPGITTGFPFGNNAYDYGVGADFAFNENLALRLETRILDGERKERGGLTTIGLRWQF